MLKRANELALARESRLVATANLRLGGHLWEKIVFLLLIGLRWRRSLKGHFNPEARWRLAVRDSPSHCSWPSFSSLIASSSAAHFTTTHRYSHRGNAKPCFNRALSADADHGTRF
jgi:hypothetical protein